jgi:hypothetical protein
MTTPGQNKPTTQKFYGAASFGGDNNGIINNHLIDARTRAYLSDMAEKAPELASPSKEGAP